MREAARPWRHGQAEVVPARRTAAHRRPAADRGARAAPRRARGRSGSAHPRSRPTRRSAPPSRCAASTGRGGCGARTSRAPGARSAAGPSSTRQTVVVGHELLAGATRTRSRSWSTGWPAPRCTWSCSARGPGRPGRLFPDELDLGSVLDRWAAAASSPDRLHVVVDRPGRRRRSPWRALGSLVGFDADRLALPDPAGRGRPGGRGLAAADRRELRRSTSTTTSWSTSLRAGPRLVADRGYDVVGDLRDLVPAPAGRVDRPGARGVRPARLDVPHRGAGRGGPSPRWGDCANAGVA